MQNDPVSLTAKCYTAHHRDGRSDFFSILHLPSWSDSHWDHTQSCIRQVSLLLHASITEQLWGVRQKLTYWFINSTVLRVYRMWFSACVRVPHREGSWEGLIYPISNIASHQSWQTLTEIGITPREAYLRSVMTSQYRIRNGANTSCIIS